MPFKNRWRLTGVLTTTTPLHVGNGDITTRSELVNEGTKRPVEISATATDHQERAYIPGTTLKGNLRAWLGRHNLSTTAVTTVFGSEDPGVDDAVGGKAEFCDAFAVRVPDPPPRVPYWNATRFTGVTASVAIERRTRTASPDKLFHAEFVPPGVGFALTVTGQDLEPDELNLLLFALEGFNHAEDPVSLGADIGNGQGRCSWNLTDIARLEPAGVTAWLQQPNLPVGYDGFVSLRDEDRKVMQAQALHTSQASSATTLTLSLTIHFDGPFLVNDPSRTKQGNQGLANETLPDHAPLRDTQGRLLLPARSVRGAVRSQTEKIVRTLKPEAACSVVDPDDACAPIYYHSQRATLCLTCQVFGAPGWSAPVEFSDFLPSAGSPSDERRQEFLAIDRFTGGGARHLKFDAVAVYRPTLAGTVSVDLNRVDPWALGLLALTLRDLIEGDIPLGFGAAKGYGACTATINDIRLPRFDALPSGLTTILEKYGATQSDFDSFDTTTPPSDAIQYAVMEFIEKFQQQVAAFQRTHAEQGG